MSEQVIVVFKLIGRKKIKRPNRGVTGKGNFRDDLLIQTMMEGPDVRPQILLQKVPQAVAQAKPRKAAPKRL